MGPTSEGPDSQALLGQARIAREQGRLADARERFQALLTRDLDATTKAEARAGLASVLHMSGLSAEALVEFHLALELREQAADLYGAAGIHLNLGLLWGDLGNQVAAFEHYEQASEILRQGGDPVRLLILHINLGRAHIEHGDLERGERITREGLELVDAGTSVRHHTLLQLNLAEALRRRQQLEEAAAHYLSVIEQATAHRMPYLKQRALHGQALVQMASGQHVKARELLFDALTMARQMNDLDAELLAMTGLAEVSLDAGQFGIALTDAELVLIRAGEGARKRFLVQGHELMARACEGLNDYRCAYEHVGQARSLEQSLYAEDSQERIRILQTKYDLDRQHSRHSRAGQKEPS
ncbi:tetratricopeptide repeat protein [Deinococcus peraridilitoris]|uniref:Uncharacterized protein n=1 Tax=Deinococcus peraridilitoris (strain DSM 19664 / LMG 22246 / CIP 109416 / KR-200) TaxID=937777 RepID=L0A3P5_DEIPD|nr:tetratricopeptide repeat protein [Deinococcus peraridilitoris]AFZ67610.1 hypothetical protein Deipe_2120 [Deinococcus peraridilitoris DSM 19664]